MRNIKFFIVVFALISFGLLTMAQPAAAKLAGKSVKIGALLPLAGVVAGWGQQQLAALKMAEEEINASGGIGGLPLEIISYDYASKPEESINLAKRLALNDKVLSINGPTLSSSCEVMFPVINRLNIATISAACAAPGLAAKNRPWAFRNLLTSDKTLGPGVKKWVEVNKINKAMIAYDKQQVVCKGEGEGVFPALLKQQGVSLIESITFLTGDVDFSAQVTKIKSLNPDGLLMCAGYPEAAGITKELRRQGYNKPLMGGITIGVPDYIRLAGGVAEGVWTATNAWADDPNPKVQKFVNEFSKRSGGLKPNSGAFRIYDNIYITKMIIETSEVTNRPEDLEKDREKIREGWANLKNYQGVSGLISINKDGDAEGEPVTLIIKDGKFVAVP